MTRVHANNFITTLNGAISSGATSIILTSVTGFPSIGAGVTCNVTISNGSDIEIVTATALSGFTLTVTRGAESTVAKAFASGSTASIRPTAGSFDGKADLASPTFTGTVVLPSTTSIGTVSSTELGYVDGVTSAIQTQIDTKQATLSGSSLTAVTVATNDKLLIQDTSDTNNLKTVTVQSVVDLATAAAVSDGDKGDVVVSSSGTVWTVDPVTGTGNFVKSTSPTLVTPALGTVASGNISACTSTSMVMVTPVLGTPTSGTLTSCTGLPLTTGVTGTLPIANGGTAVTSVTTSPTASSFAGWDANSNLSFNSGLRGYATTATAAGTTTLVVGSKQVQYFTGSTTQTVTLPVTSTLVLGQMFRIVNNSSGVVTVQSSGANAILAMNANSWAEFTVILTTGTGVASWDYSFGTNASTLYLPQTINANRFLVTGGSNNVVTGVGNTACAVPVTNASATISMAACGTTGQLLRGSTAAAAAFSTAVFADTYSASTLLYSNGANNVAGLATANNGVLVTSGTGVPSISATLPTGVTTANLLDGYSTTATAAGTTTLVVGSNRQQFFTGSTTQTVLLPVASTLTLGQYFEIINLSTGVVTVQSSGANTIQAMAANTRAKFTCTTISGTGTSSWNYTYQPTANDITGSGSLVRATSPTLVTPVLGAATATSINFGGSSLSDYITATSWTPVFSFATAGDISVTYAARNAYYVRIGNMVTITFYMQCTPTYTTASGAFTITGLPITGNGNVTYSGAGAGFLQGATSWPVASTNLSYVVPGGTSTAKLIGSGAAGSALQFSTTQMTSGVEYVLGGSITYLI